MTKIIHARRSKSSNSVQAGCAPISRKSVARTENTSQSASCNKRIELKDDTSPNSSVDWLLGSETDPGVVGNLLRDLREESRLSLRAAAQATGVSGVYISMVERAERKLKKVTLEKLMALYRVTPASLQERYRQQILGAQPSVIGEHENETSPQSRIAARRLSANRLDWAIQCITNDPNGLYGVDAIPDDEAARAAFIMGYQTGTRRMLLTPEETVQLRYLARGSKIHARKRKRASSDEK